MNDFNLINWFIASILIIYYWFNIIYTYFKYKDSYLLEDKMFYAVACNVMILWMVWLSLCYVINYYYYYLTSTRVFF